MRAQHDLVDPASSRMANARAVRIAVVIPCYNEAPTIGQLVRDFRAHLPQAQVYVFDNNSSDNTGQLAREAGAVVRNVAMQGKGSVVRRMFADVEADAYIMIDGAALTS